MDSEMIEHASTEMIVGHENGKVFLRFRQAMELIVFDPANCIDVACAMTNAAFEADTTLKPVGETLKAELGQGHRDKLVPRIALMLHTLRDDKTKSNGAVALQLVDTMLSEVLS